MLGMINEALSFPFMVRALIVGALISLCAALLGVSLVLKRFSMIGDCLSHVGFFSLAVATALQRSPLAVSIPTVVLAAFFIMQIDEGKKVSGDSALALFSSGSLAAGVMIISLTTGMNTDVCNYMFGSILSLSVADAKLSVLLSLITIILFTLCYHRLFSITFDETFARATGLRVKTYNALRAVLTAVTIVLGMRMMGALLISSLIVFPPMSAMRVSRTYLGSVLLASFISVLCFCAGMFLSFAAETPSGSSVVVMNVLVFGILSLAERVKGGRA